MDNMEQTWRRAAQAAALALGAPLGWLAIRWVQGSPPLGEVASRPELYAYLLFATMTAFASFGAALGSVEDRLDRERRALEEISVTDGLTQLRNARYFQARLREEMASAARASRPLALAIIDLDHFKRVNDRHGHQSGDRVLLTVAQMITGAARQGETVARIGGDEFGMLLPDEEGAVAAVAGERVRAAIAASLIRLPERCATIHLTVSVGVASTAELVQATPEGLYAAADDMLYAAKRYGRNRVFAWPPSVEHRGSNGDDLAVRS